MLSKCASAARATCGSMPCVSHSTAYFAVVVLLPKSVDACVGTMNTVTATNGIEEPQTESGAAYLQPLSSHCSTSKKFVTKTTLLAGCRCALLTLYSCIFLWLAAGPLFSHFVFYWYIPHSRATCISKQQSL